MTDSRYLHGTEEAEQQRLTTLNRLTNPAFLDFLRLDGATSILEVGSGLGILTREVALRAPHAEVIGLERSARQLARAPEGVANLRFVAGDAHELPFDNDRFDVVYCRYVLEHVPHPAQVVAEMRRVLRPGGRIFVMENDNEVECHDPPIPGFRQLWERMIVLQARLGGDGLIGRKLFRLLQVAGFRDIELSMTPEIYWAGTPGLAIWVENLAAIIRGCKEDLVRHGLATADEVERSVNEYLALLEREDASVWFYWNRACGVK